MDNLMENKMVTRSSKKTVIKMDNLMDNLMENKIVTKSKSSKRKLASEICYYYRNTRSRRIKNIKNTEVFKKMQLLYKNNVKSADDSWTDWKQESPRILKFLPITRDANKKERGYSIEGSVFGYAICTYECVVELEELNKYGVAPRDYEVGFDDEVLYTNIEPYLVPIRHSFNEKWYCENIIRDNEFLGELKTNRLFLKKQDKETISEKTK